MEAEVVTIKDIAAALNVSLSTVHKAIYHKKGISDATRRRILQYIQDNNFQVNQVASALRRQTLRIAYVGTAPAGPEQYFAREIIRGVEQAYKEIRTFNISLSQYHTAFDPESQTALLSRLLAREGDQLDGLLLYPSHESLLNPLIAQFTRRGTRVVTLNSDAVGSTRDAFVSCDSTTIGRTAAQLIYQLCGSHTGSVLFLAGRHDLANHQMTAREFLHTAHALAPELNIIELYESPDWNRFRDSVRLYLTAFPQIQAAYSISSRTTLLLCQTIRELGLTGKFKVIGSDVFPELIPFFNDGTLTFSIFQNPQAQCACALRLLLDLSSGKADLPTTCRIPPDIAIQANADVYLRDQAAYPASSL